MTTLAVPQTELDLILAALDDPAFVDGLTDKQLDSILWALQEASYAPGSLHLQPHQLPPPGDDWFGWLFSAGRGAGKTDAVCKDFYAHAMGPPCDPMLPGGHRLAIVGPTLGDVATSCYEGPSGLLRLDERVRLITRTGGTYVVFPNGALAKCVGGNTVAEAKRLRAHGNTCRVWVEEAAAIRALSTVWSQILLSCRHGHRPRATLSSTPINSHAYKRIMRDPNVVVTNASMDDNAFLNEDYKRRMRDTFAGTATEAQELDGRLVEETPGALWTEALVDRRRINVAELRAKIPPADGEAHELWLRRALRLTTVFVGLDPATSGKGDRTGVVVVGASPPNAAGERLVFVLEDLTAMMVPSLVDFGDADGDDALPSDIQGWAEVVSATAYRWQANAIVVEKNRLGRTARAVIRAAGFTGRIVERSATDSKWNRADPVRAAWSRLMFIVGSWPILETDMTSWVPAAGDDPVEDDGLGEGDPEFAGSPDALDAMVHAARVLLGVDRPRKKRAGSPVGAALEAGWNGG